MQTIFSVSERRPQVARLLQWLPFLIISVLAVVAHRFAFNADFYMDDYAHILHSGAVRDAELGGIQWRWLTYLIWSAAEGWGELTGPVLHALNLAVHVAVACILFPVGLSFLRRAGVFESEGQRRLAAFLGAAVFACHPATTEAVHYTRCLMIDLVTLFSVLAAWATLRLTEKPSLGRAALVLATLAGAAVSKQPGFAHALANVVLVALAFANWKEIRALGERRLRPRELFAGTLLLVGLTLLMAPWIQWMFGYFKAEALFLEHTLTQGRVFWAYLARMVMPLGLDSDHYVPWSMGFGDTKAVVLTIAVLLTGAAAFVMLFRPKTRLAGLLLCLAFAPLLLRFGYVVRELMVEYRMYPALPWVGLLFGCALAWLWKRWRLAGGVAIAVVLGSFVVLSNERSVLWMNAGDLAEVSLERNDLNLRALTIAQSAALKSDDADRVLQLAERVEDIVAENEKFNSRTSDRGYELLRVYQHVAVAYQLAAYAEARRNGLEAGLRYAEETLADLSGRYPQYYLDAQTGEPDATNALVQARNTLESFVDLKKQAAVTVNPAN